MLKKVVNFFSLFGSVGTLLCCALPAALVSLGMGATFASLTSSFPQLIWISQHKGKLFIVTGALLILSFFLLRHAETLACPIDEDQRDACQRARNYNKPIFWISVSLYLVGLSFAYIIPRLIYGL